jgi:hypothetical protein
MNPNFLSQYQSRLFHTFFGGIEVDENGNSTRPPFDWKALWASFDDIECDLINKNDNKVPNLVFKKSTRKGECGLSSDGTHIHFPLFYHGSICDIGSHNEDVIQIVKIPLPEVINKSFFKKMAQLIGFVCKDPNSSAKNVKWTCNWDWYSF